jgi:hypothetical protein
MATINELALEVGRLNRAMSSQAGLDPYSPVIFGVASGLDIAITIFEQFTGARISEASSDAATLVIQYFHDEAKRSEAVDPQIAICYRSWAKVLASKYLRT